MQNNLQKRTTSLQGQKDGSQRCPKCAHYFEVPNFCSDMENFILKLPATDMEVKSFSPGISSTVADHIPAGIRGARRG